MIFRWRYRRGTAATFDREVGASEFKKEEPIGRGQAMGFGVDEDSREAMS